MTGKPVCEPHDSTGEPGAGNRPAGFGERGEETYPRDSACGPVAKAPCGSASPRRPPRQFADGGLSRPRRRFPVDVIPGYPTQDPNRERGSIDARAAAGRTPPRRRDARAGLVRVCRYVKCGSRERQFERTPSGAGLPGRAHRGARAGARTEARDRPRRTVHRGG